MPIAIDDLTNDYINTFDASLVYFYEFHKELKSEIDNDSTLYMNLSRDVLNDVIKYCEDNDVQIKNFDDYKIVYFLGIKLEELKNDFNYMITTVQILEILLYLNSKSKFRISKDMLSKVMESIKKQKWKNHYGLYGIYSIFKICSKLE